MFDVVYTCTLWGSVIKMHLANLDSFFVVGIWDDIVQCRTDIFQRRRSGSTCITDITDGEAYQDLMSEGGFLDPTANSVNLTAMFNTDGVNLYSSSKIELWPIFLAINELSPVQRFARDNMILAGIWQGKGKPPFWQFLTIFCEEMNELYSSGIEVQLDKYETNIT